MTFGKKLISIFQNPCFIQLPPTSWTWVWSGKTVEKQSQFSGSTYFSHASQKELLCPTITGKTTNKKVLCKQFMLCGGNSELFQGLLSDFTHNSNQEQQDQNTRSNCQVLPRIKPCTDWFFADFVFDKRCRDNTRIYWVFFPRAHDTQRVVILLLIFLWFFFSFVVSLCLLFLPEVQMFSWNESKFFLSKLSAVHIFISVFLCTCIVDNSIDKIWNHKAPETACLFGQSQQKNFASLMCVCVCVRVYACRL